MQITKRFYVSLGFFTAIGALCSSSSLGRTDPLPDIQVETNYRDVQAGRMKVTSLLTALDYSVERANSVNGVPTGNFLKDCQYDNALKLSEEYCRDIQRKHMTESDVLFFPDNGLALNMWRAIATREEIVFNVVVSQSRSTVRLRLNVKRGVPPDESFQNGSPSPPSEQWKSNSVDDYAKIVDWAKLNFGNSNVKFVPAAKKMCFRNR